MKKKANIIYILIVVCCTCSLIVYFLGTKGISVNNKEDLDQKIKVESFIKNNLLGKLRISQLPDKYQDLDKESLVFFLQLENGVDSFEDHNPEMAWESWSYCLKNNIGKYLPEFYLIIARELGEQDAKSCYILLQKSLQLIDASREDNWALKYACLNELISLLVSQAEDDVLDQDVDKMAKRYSMEAHHLLKDPSFPYKEKDASGSIYRIVTESLYWLGEDSLANSYVHYLQENKKDYLHPELTDSYVKMLMGVKSYIHADYQGAKHCFLDAVQGIGKSTSFLNYDLELPYAYLGIIYHGDTCFAKSFDYLERSIKTLQSKFYKHIDDPFKNISLNKFEGKEGIYNTILCYIRMLRFYKSDIQINKSGEDINKMMDILRYTNSLIKYWFLNAADENTLLRATKLIKKSNAIAVDVIYDNKSFFKDSEQQIYQLETEASSLYLTYLIQIKKQEHLNPGFIKLNNLAFELMEAEKDSLQFIGKNIEKRLELIQLKDHLWDKSKNDVEQLVSKNLLAPVLKKNEGLIKYFFSGSGLYVSYFMSGSCGIKRLDSKDVKSHMQKFKYDIKTGVDSKTEQRYLYDVLIAPIQKELVGVKRLLFLPDELMSDVIFELLMDKEDHLLIEKCAIKYSYSSSRICGFSYLNNNVRFLSFAPGFKKDISWTNSLSHLFSDHISDKKIKLGSLPHSIEEVNEVAAIFKEDSGNVRVFEGENATKDNFIDCLKWDADVVHIATHGVSDGRYNSGLYFYPDGDGNDFLSLQELYAFTNKSKLVVLSACKTGIGEIETGEGVLALPRGFICAGTKNVMASQWKVQDKKTAYLMSRFYYYLLTNKICFSEALQMAKLDCIKKGFQILDWAGFLLISG